MAKKERLQAKHKTSPLSSASLLILILITNNATILENIYGAVIKTVVIARVYSVNLMNIEQCEAAANA